MADFGIAGIVLTKGKDISQLMAALGSLHQKYGLIYSVQMAAAVFSLASLALSLWRSWGNAQRFERRESTM